MPRCTQRNGSSVCCGAWGRLWHETDMRTALRDVRSQGQSGKHLLALSFSGFDRCCRKSLLGVNKRNFLKLLMRFVRSDVRGPHRFSEKRPRTVVSTLKSIATAE